MFLPVLEGMTATEINQYTVIDHGKKSDLEKLEQLVPLYKLSFFGPQFTFSNSTCLVLYKTDTLWFIWRNDFNQPLCEAKIAFDQFCEVFTTYIVFCEQEKLL